MKKLFLIFLLILLPLVARTSAMMVVGSGGSPPSYSDILFWWRCEDETMGAGDYSAGDTVGTVSGGAVFNTDAVKLGTNGMDCPTSQDYTSFSVSSSDIFVESAGRLGFWIYINTWAVNAFLVDVTAATGNFRFSTTGTDELAFRYNDGAGGDRTATTTDANLTTGTWYYLELAWDTSTELQKIYVNGSEKASNATAKATTGAVSIIKFGNSYDGTADLYMDNIIISNDPARNLYLLKDVDNFPG